MGTGKLISAACVAVGVICLARAAYIPAKGVVAGALMERAWDKSQAAGTSVSPWASLDARPLARLRVDRLGASEIVLDTDTGQALAFAPSHIPQTAIPGRPGLSVIAAHKNTHFAFLKQVKPGDIITVESVGGQASRFKVTDAQVVDKDASGLTPAKSGAPRLALVTCYPFNALSYGGPLRYVVYADAV